MKFIIISFFFSFFLNLWAPLNASAASLSCGGLTEAVTESSQQPLLETLELRDSILKKAHRESSPVSVEDKISLLETIARDQFPGFFTDHPDLFPESPRLREKFLKKLSRIDLETISPRQIQDLLQILFFNQRDPINQKIERGLLQAGLVRGFDQSGFFDRTSVGARWRSLASRDGNVRRFLIMALDSAWIAFKGINVTTPLGILLPKFSFVSVKNLRPELIEDIIRDGLQAHLEEVRLALGIRANVDSTTISPKKFGIVPS